MMIYTDYQMITKSYTHNDTITTIIITIITIIIIIIKSSRPAQLSNLSPQGWRLSTRS